MTPKGSQPYCLIMLIHRTLEERRWQHFRSAEAAFGGHTSGCRGTIFISLSLRFFEFDLHCKSCKRKQRSFWWVPIALNLGSSICCRQTTCSCSCACVTFRGLAAILLPLLKNSFSQLCCPLLACILCLKTPASKFAVCWQSFWQRRHQHKRQRCSTFQSYIYKRFWP